MISKCLKDTCSLCSVHEECIETERQVSVSLSYFTVQFRRKEGNILFNTFYLRLCGVGHTVNDYLDNVRGNPLPPLHDLDFYISSKGSFICTMLFFYRHLR